ncbi:MAG TPA: DUF4157 domain-containing protein, partial [Actinomycetota bacterium]|nr:DUF4157 domain-containing protein [Actinomycetota bacterium]
MPSGWDRLPPIARALESSMPLVVDHAGARAALSSHARPALLLAPLSHTVSPTAPAGIVWGWAAPTRTAELEPEREAPAARTFEFGGPARVLASFTEDPPGAAPTKTAGNGGSPVGPVAFAPPGPEPVRVSPTFEPARVEAEPTSEPVSPTFEPAPCEADPTPAAAPPSFEPPRPEAEPTPKAPRPRRFKGVLGAPLNETSSEPAVHPGAGSLERPQQHPPAKRLSRARRVVGAEDDGAPARQSPGSRGTPEPRRSEARRQIEIALRREADRTTRQSAEAARETDATPVAPQPDAAPDDRPSLAVDRPSDGIVLAPPESVDRPNDGIVPGPSDPVDVAPKVEPRWREDVVETVDTQTLLPASHRAEAALQDEGVSPDGEVPAQAAGEALATEAPLLASQRPGLALQTEPFALEGEVSPHETDAFVEAGPTPLSSQPDEVAPDDEPLAAEVSGDEAGRPVEAERPALPSQPVELVLHTEPEVAEVPPPGTDALVEERSPLPTQPLGLAPQAEAGTGAESRHVERSSSAPVEPRLRAKPPEPNGEPSPHEAAPPFEPTRREKFVTPVAERGATNDVGDTVEGGAPLLASQPVEVALHGQAPVQDAADVIEERPLPASRPVEVALHPDAVDGTPAPPRVERRIDTGARSSPTRSADVADPPEASRGEIPSPGARPPAELYASMPVKPRVPADEARDAAARDGVHELPPDQPVDVDAPLLPRQPVDLTLHDDAAPLAPEGENRSAVEAEPPVWSSPPGHVELRGKAQTARPEGEPPRQTGPKDEGGRSPFVSHPLDIALPPDAELPRSELVGEAAPLLHSQPVEIALPPSGARRSELVEEHRTELVEERASALRGRPVENAVHDGVRGKLRVDPVGSPVHDGVRAQLRVGPARSPQADGLREGAPHDVSPPDSSRRGSDDGVHPAERLTDARIPYTRPPSSASGPVEEPSRPLVGDASRETRRLFVARDDVETVPEDARRVAESATATDLGGTPVVRDRATTREAAALGARAFARQGAVHLPRDLGPTGIEPARSLLVHELVHVAQQRTQGAGLPPENS